MGEAQSPIFEADQFCACYWKGKMQVILSPIHFVMRTKDLSFHPIKRARFASLVKSLSPLSVAALRMWVLFCDALIDKPIQLKINYRSRLNLDKAIQAFIKVGKELKIV